MTIIKTKQGLIDGLEKADCDIYLGFLLLNRLSMNCAF